MALFAQAPIPRSVAMLAATAAADVDALYEEFRQRGVSIEHPPENSLGPDLRDMLVMDPDGNRLSFLTRSRTDPRG